MYYLLFEKDDIRQWEAISGEDDMQIRVCELVAELNCEASDILVFPDDAEIK